MDGNTFELAHKALSAVELYRGHYASGAQFHEEKKRIAEMLRVTAESSATKVHAPFLKAFADAIEAI